MESIFSLTLDELQDSLAQKFRAKQIFHWIYSHYAHNARDMKNLPSTLRDEISQRFECNDSLHSISIAKIEESSDGTRKYLFRTKDNHSFESVFIKMREKIMKNERVIKSEKYTFCLSSQIGCQVGCVFCSTAKGGFVRNLSVNEIVEQVVFLKRDNGLDGNKSINIVFMGMGEPLLNLSNVSKAIKILSCTEGLSIAPRRQTISTSGIAPQIENLGKLDLGVQIALSLHAVNDELRTRLIPMNRVYNIEKILESLRNFPLKNRRRILFEYLVIKDVNDSIKDAKSLVRLLHEFKAKVNLIPFNPHEESEFERPSMESLKHFSDYLYQRGILATIRESKGIDISAACGQLRQKYHIH